MPKPIKLTPEQKVVLDSVNKLDELQKASNIVVVRAYCFADFYLQQHPDDGKICGTCGGIVGHAPGCLSIEAKLLMSAVIKVCEI
jgi:hypothetical protein